MDERLRSHSAPVAALADDVRRRLYLFIRRRRRPVTREEAATAVGISAKLAAFHLDKLVDRGLLVFRYARPAGRSGPGAGRPAKIYEPSEIEVEVSIPERRYDLLGRLLVGAIEDDRPNETSHETAVRVAAEAGHQIGQELRSERRLRRLGPDRALAIAEETLDPYGYEPYRESDGSLSLRNCPFHSLAQRSPEVVCEMNRSLLNSFIRALGNESVQVELDRAPGRCCVVMHPPAPRR